MKNKFLAGFTLMFLVVAGAYTLGQKEGSDNKEESPEPVEKKVPVEVPDTRVPLTVERCR